MPVPAVTNRGLFLALAARPSGIGLRVSTYDQRPRLGPVALCL
jgi:hypothetical protein